jgi:hypothetical protein
MRIKEVNYGRTIEVGRLGRGRSGRVWFGWTAEVEEGETEADVLKALQDKADEQEKQERRAFDRREGRTPPPETGTEEARRIGEGDPG